MKLECVGSQIVFNQRNQHAILDEPLFTGRKGIAYDWQQLFLPSDAVFEASLETLLNAGKDDSAPRYA